MSQCQDNNFVLLAKSQLFFGVIVFIKVSLFCTILSQLIFDTFLSMVFKSGLPPMKIALVRSAIQPPTEVKENEAHFVVRLLDKGSIR